MRGYYEFAGRWPEAVAFNQLIAPGELTLEDDRKLVFCAENQGVVIWATTPEGGDPPVYIKGSTMDDPLGSRGWVEEGEPLSRFLLQLVLFEAMIGAPFGGVALAQPEPGWSAVVAPLSPLPLAGWHWPATDTRLWVGDDVIAQTCPDPGADTREVHVGARTEEAARYLEALRDVDWDTLWPEDA